MSNEKHHDQSGLKNKLEILSFLPGEPPMDKNGCWEKLYIRLHEKPNRKPVGWYQVAAACLLLAAALFAWMKTNTTKNNIFLSSPHKNAGGQAAAPPPYKQYALPAPASSTIKIKKPGRHFPERKMISTPTEGLPDPVATETNISIQMPGLTGSSPVSGITMTATPAPVHLKKNLRVVHVNELDEPPEEDNLASNTARHMVRVKWFEQPRALNASPEAGRSGDEILKISLSPN